MVYYQSAALDRTFAALSDPTRRALLQELDGRDSVSVSELARPLPMSLPAVMKHLDVLSDAGLVRREKIGRTVMCSLNAGPMRDAAQWLDRYARFWGEQLDRLATYLENETACPPPPQQQPALPGPPSPSNVASMPHPQGSSKPGPTRRK